MRDHGLRNFVVLSNGNHAAMARELKIEPFGDAADAIAVECACSGVASRSLGDETPSSARTLSAQHDDELRSIFPEMKYLELDSHGYMLVDVTAGRVHVEWWNVPGTLERLAGETLAAAFEIPNGKVTLVQLGETQEAEASTS
jgi:alkaline phosphatase D